MPFLSPEKERIDALKQRIADERGQLGEQARELMPGARSLAIAGVVTQGLHVALPLVRPLALTVARRGVSRRGFKRLIKIAGLGALAFGAWRLFTDSGDEEA